MCIRDSIRVIGTLTGSDVLFLLSFIYLASRLKLRVSTPLARKFIVLCLLWLSSQIATDLIRHTMFIKIARSWSSISDVYKRQATMLTWKRRSRETKAQMYC